MFSREPSSSSGTGDQFQVNNLDGKWAVMDVEGRNEEAGASTLLRKEVRGGERQAAFY